MERENCDSSLGPVINGKFTNESKREEDDVESSMCRRRTQNNFNSVRHYQINNGGNHRMYQNRNIGYEPRTRHYCKPIYSNRQPKSFQNTYELDGQQKFTLKQRYFENLRCPTCIMNNLSQTWKYQGMPWRNLTVNYRTDFKDLYEALHAELDDFYKFIRPNNEDRVFRKATYYCIANSIKRSKKYEIDSVRFIFTHSFYLFRSFIYEKI